MKRYAVSPEVAKAREAMLDALKPYADSIEAIGMVAALSQTLGQMISLLDQRHFSVAQAMQVVEENLAAGNAAMIEQQLGKPRGSA